MFKIRIASIGIALALMLTIFPNSSIFAKEESCLVDLSGLTLTQIAELYPTSAEDAAKITYDFIKCSVVVDGISYEAEQMTYFNGQVLHFIYSKDGVLNAFKSMSDLEQYMFEEYGHVWGNSSESNSINSDLDTGCNIYYENWYYGGSNISIPWGDGDSDLSDDDMDNCIDSAHTYTWSTLYDGVNFTGWSLSCSPDDWWWFFGSPHDTTSSIAVDDA